MRVRLFLLLNFLLFAQVYGASQSAKILFISLSGNDAWSGTLTEPNTDKTDGPLRTLTAARDRIRQIKSTHTAAAPITVQIRGGDYFLDDTFELTQQDGGTEQAPIHYMGYDDENVRLIAGQTVSGFKPVTDPDVLKRFRKECQSHILQADLKSLGIEDFGELRHRGFSRGNIPSRLELFFQNRPMTLARWPNTGWLLIDTVPQGPEGGCFTYAEDRPDTWAVQEDIWVHGFWTHDWADSFEHVKSIDPATNTITTYPPHGVYGYSEKHRYYFLNVMEELDTPGEWYLDDSRGVLYFWPPASLEEELPIVSMTDTIFSLQDCSHVTFSSMTLECTRSTAVRITGGKDVVIENCVIRNTGNLAVEIRKGQAHGVIGCEIYESGDGGIYLDGGDQPTLTPAGHYVVNNHIYRYNRWRLTYGPAIQISGVGNRIAHNTIHDGPHNAIQLGGNEHVIEFNEIYDVCNATDDVGAFYSGRSWINRGNVIRYNYFHHIHSAPDRLLNGSRVVYLDDAASGFTVYGNVFYKAGSLCAINVGGGRDNRIENNIFIDCKVAAYIDSRGTDWATNHIAKGGGWQMYEKLERVNYDQPPFSTRYPELATILEEAPAEPRGNKLINNLAVNTQILNMSESYQHLLEQKGNWSTEQDPGFFDIEQEDFRLKEDSPVFQQIPGFQKIPFDRIGPVPDSGTTGLEK